LLVVAVVVAVAVMLKFLRPLQKVLILPFLLAVVAVAAQVLLLALEVLAVVAEMVTMAYRQTQVVQVQQQPVAQAEIQTHFQPLLGLIIILMRLVALAALGVQLGVQVLLDI
jgi:hypothetical protein